MSKHIKLKLTSEGKMLSGFVNKYINERGTFDAKICQYTFGLDGPEPARSERKEPSAIS